MARSGSLAAVAAHHGQDMSAFGHVQPDHPDQVDEDDNSTVVPVPRWLVVTLNCVMLGGVAATVSVALLGMRRSSSLGSKSQAHANAMADILAGAGRRRGWTDARTERVLHLIGVQRSPMPAVRGSMPRLDQHVPVRVDGVRPRVLTVHHERHTTNPLAATPPGLNAGLVVQARRGGSLQRTRLPADHISPQRANSRGEQSGYNNTELYTGCEQCWPFRCLMQY
jgi:hypothetical protein